MSLTRGNLPGFNVDSYSLTEGEYKIGGQLSVGYKDGKFVDQYEYNVIDQGLACAQFDISTLKAGVSNTSSLKLRLESERLHNKTGKYGLNFGFTDGKLGTIRAYTYDYSIFDSLSYLSQFADDPTNESHVLYAYISQINKILKVIAGTTSLTSSSSSKDDIKGAVLSNVNKFIFGINGETESEQNDFVSNSGTTGNVLRFKIDLSKVDPSFSEPFILELDFNGNDAENILINAKIENLKIGTQYGTFKVGIIDCYENNQFDLEKARIPNWTAPIGDIQKDAYVDLSDLPLLVKIGLKTTELTKYYIVGKFTLQYKILGIPNNYVYDTTILVNISDKIDESTGLFSVNGYFKIKYKDDYCSEVFLNGQEVFMKKWKKNYGFFGNYQNTTIRYFKCTNEQFINDILYYLFMDILESSTIYNAIPKDPTTDSNLKPLNFINYFQNDAANNQFKLGLNGEVITAISLTGEIDLKYDLASSKITALTGSVGIGIPVLGSVNFILDFSLNYNLTDINNNENHYNLFITTFNSHPESSKLRNRIDHNDSINGESIIEITKKDKNFTSYLDPSNNI